MEHDTARTPDRVSPRDTASRLRAGFARLGVAPEVIRQIIPAENINRGQLVRMGTWDPASADALASAIEVAALVIDPAVDTPPPPTAS